MEISTREKILQIVSRYVIITLSISIMTIGVYFFKFPNNFVFGGVTGDVYKRQALLQDHDAVCVADSGEAVGDDEAGAATHQAVHAALHQRLGAGVDGGSLSLIHIWYLPAAPHL